MLPTLLLFLLILNLITTYSVILYHRNKEINDYLSVEKFSFIEAMILNRIREEFKNYTEQDFEVTEGELSVEVDYNDLVATIQFGYPYETNSILVYDDICQCVSDYYYKD